MAAGNITIDNATPDDRKEAVVVLAYPVTLADRELKDVTMRRPTLGDLLDHEPKTEDDVKEEVQLIGILCGLKPEEMRLLDSTDYRRLQQQYVRFRAVPK